MASESTLKINIQKVDNLLAKREIELTFLSEVSIKNKELQQKVLDLLA